MNTEKLGQEPACPVTGNVVHAAGMSKRFYAACAAMQGICSGIYSSDEAWASFAKAAQSLNKTIDVYLAESAYGAADELLKQENE